MEVKYSDPETNIESREDKVDYKFILMRQIDKIRLSRSNEMRGGYYDSKIISVAGGHMEQKVYIPDTREIYINSVKIFEILLVIHFDDEYKEFVNELDNKDKSKDELVEVYDEIFKELVVLMQRKGLIALAKTFNDSA